MCGFCESLYISIEKKSEFDIMTVVVDYEVNNMNKKTADFYRKRFTQLFFAVDAAYFTLYKQEGLGRREAEMVWHILNHKTPLTQAELCKLMALPKQSVHSLVLQEREKGFLEFVPSPDDGRLRVVRMTEEGEEHYNAIVERIRQVERDTFLKLTKEQSDEMIRSMETFLAAFTEEIEK